MNSQELVTALEIARTALEHKTSADLIARELDLSNEELDRIFELIEKKLAAPFYQRLKA